MQVRKVTRCRRAGSVGFHKKRSLSEKGPNATLKSSSMTRNGKKGPKATLSGRKVSWTMIPKEKTVRGPRENPAVAPTNRVPNDPEMSTTNGEASGIPFTLNHGGGGNGPEKDKGIHNVSIEVGRGPEEAALLSKAIFRLEKLIREGNKRLLSKDILAKM